MLAVTRGVQERLLRELQWEATGRVLERRGLLLADRDLELAGVQHEASALGTTGRPRL